MALASDDQLKMVVVLYILRGITRILLFPDQSEQASKPLWHVLNVIDELGQIKKIYKPPCTKFKVLYFFEQLINFLEHYHSNDESDI